MDDPVAMQMNVIVSRLQCVHVCREGEREREHREGEHREEEELKAAASDV